MPSQVDTAMAHARHVEMTPRLGAREDLLARIVAKGHRHDLRLVTARVERGGQLAHEDLGAAVHERHLCLQDQNAERCHSGREAEVDDIAVLDDVFLAFEAHLSVIAARRHRAA